MKLTFIALRTFDAQLPHVFRTTRDGDEYMRALQLTLLDNPERGDLMPRTGGARKIRIQRPGTGKSGGARVVYVYFATASEVYFLAVYAKSDQENLTREGEDAIRALIEALKED